MDKTKINLERLRAYDAEWEEDKHPRAENGQFTSGSAGGSANGSSESSAKSHNLLAEPKSPLRHAAETIQGSAGNAESGAGKKSKSLRSVLNQGPEVAKGESQWEHEQNIKLMKGLEQAEKDEKHQIVISWIVHDLRNGMSAKEAFAKADKDVQNGRFGGGPFAQESLHKWWKKWSYKWGPQEEEG